MDREYYLQYYLPMDSHLTPEQMRHEKESFSKIFDKYRMSNTGMLGTFIVGVGVGGRTFLALKRRGLITKVLVPTLTGGLTMFRAFMYTYKVSVVFQMIIIS